MLQEFVLQQGLPYEWVYLVSSITLIIFSILVYIERERTRRPILSILLFVAGLWAIVSFFVTFFGAQYGVILSKVGIGFGLALPPLWLYFSAQVSGRDGLLNSVIYGGGISWALLVLSAVTNDLHFLFWNSHSATFPPFGGRVILEPGPLFWIALLWSYSLVFLGQWILFQAAFSRKSIPQNRFGILVGASCMALLANMLSFPGIPPFQGDLTPIGLALGGLLITTSIIRSDANSQNFDPEKSSTD